jgi:hypothetical protein
MSMTKITKMMDGPGGTKTNKIMNIMGINMGINIIKDLYTKKPAHTKDARECSWARMMRMRA